MAHVEQILAINPIVGADRIEVATVLGWQVVVKKGEFQVGDRVVYIEIDSRVPSDKEYFSFLEKYKYRIKSQKLRGQISQGLVIPMSLLPKAADHYEIGQDVSEELGITKIQEDYEPPKFDQNMQLRQRHKKLSKNPVFKWLMKYEWFRKIAFFILIPKKKKSGWPAWVEKTDEIRCQNIPWVLEKKVPFEVSEKLDGTSSTYTLRKIGKNKFEFLVCSRNVVQATPDKKCFYETNVYWEMAKKYNIEEALKSLIGDNEWITLQGETIGPDIQKNKYALKEREFYAFNLITEKGGRLAAVPAQVMLATTDIKWVPMISYDYYLPSTLEELMEYSTGPATFLPTTLREGYVFRNYELGISFKCVSNAFLLKWEI